MANRPNRPAHRSVVALAALAALAACQTGDNAADVLDLNGTGGQDVITAADLRAYCPPVILREGTAFFREYTDGNDGNADELIYQASIADVTRSCRYRNGQLQMTVAAAGRVVAGPKGGATTVELPIRVAITAGETNPYSQLDRLSVSVSPSAGASQFLFNNEQIVIPEPAERNLTVFVGFDPGPYDTP